MLTIVVIVAQFFWIRSDFSFDKALPFLSGLTPADTAAGNMFLLMYSYLPFPFIFLYFSGEMQNLTKGYGLLLAIRGSNRIKLLASLMGKTFISVSILAASMGGLYTVGKAEHWISFDHNLQVHAVILYGFTIILLIQMEFLLELYVESRYAFGAVTIWGITAIFISGSLRNPSGMADLLLFPNLAFAQKNGAIEGMGHSVMPAYMTLIFIYSALTILILIRIRKKDMI